ncbi:MAG TPA: HAD family hydrolase [Gemmataceae bacterium]|nr:HAD family hydrolase [Gemmataceae bacterium]
MADVRRRAVFLDRDGTLIEDVGYPNDPRAVRLLPGAAAALARLQEQGFRLIVISNQSGIGRGMVSPEQARQVHEELARQLGKRNVQLDGAYYCPHAPEDGCACRKPSPSLLLRAGEELQLDLSQSFMIGDKVSDVEAGRAAGCRTIFFKAGAESQAPARADFVAASWSDVTEYITGASVKIPLPRT